MITDFSKKKKKRQPTDAPLPIIIRKNQKSIIPLPKQPHPIRLGHILPIIGRERDHSQRRTGIRRLEGLGAIPRVPARDAQRLVAVLVRDAEGVGAAVGAEVRRHRQLGAVVRVERVVLHAADDPVLEGAFAVAVVRHQLAHPVLLVQVVQAHGERVAQEVGLAGRDRGCG